MNTITELLNLEDSDIYISRRAEVLLFRKHSSAGLYKYWDGGQIGTYLSCIRYWHNTIFLTSHYDLSILNILFINIYLYN